jgi:GH15 family glucan-1,4-alpha-glucosidase
VTVHRLGRHDGGYLPLEDYGLIGDGATAALVGRDGAIPWLCLPRFDSPALFCGLLDTARGGAFTVAPDPLVASGQRYEPDSGVLVTELHGPDGVIELTDAMTLRSGADLAEDSPAGRSELLRSARVLAGRVRLGVEFEPRGGATVEPRGGGLRVRPTGRPDLDLHLVSSTPLPGLPARLELRAGERVDLLLRWRPGAHRTPAVAFDRLLDASRAAWRAWTRRLAYDGPQRELVRRSAITLKLLAHVTNGAIVAAPTSSLLDALGGPRNWDYRYAWIRDAAFSVYALRRIGLTEEAARFLAWVLDAVDRHGHPRVLYDLDGQDPPPERVDPVLEGYRRSAPVRWGNAAATQRQHDVYGEILDCAFQWTSAGGHIDQPLWRRLDGLVEAAGRDWDTPDHGIWEVRTSGRPFTYTAALCQVALDRGARLAERVGLGHCPEVGRWRATAARIQRAVLKDAWDPDRRTITEHLGGGGLDASLLALPLRRVVHARHPRMVATTAAGAERLGDGGGLLYRYLPEDSPDGLPGHEGALLLCSFWLVDNLAMQGRLEEAMALFDSLYGRAGPLGLLPEQLDPSTGAFLGNYPQAFSHVGLVSSGVNLARASRR